MKPAMSVPDLRPSQRALPAQTCCGRRCTGDGSREAGGAAMVHALMDTVRPWGSGRVYQIFPDPDLVNWADAYYGSNGDRLVQVKRKYDPNDFLRFDQSIPVDEWQ